MYLFYVTARLKEGGAGLLLCEQIGPVTPKSHVFLKFTWVSTALDQNITSSTKIAHVCDENHLSEEELLSDCLVPVRGLVFSALQTGAAALGGYSGLRSSRSLSRIGVN